jgi:crotonobetainyl-CoA:carnitine CoA-transferase CaiB-like acyl-CoA transferase
VATTALTESRVARIRQILADLVHQRQSLRGATDAPETVLLEANRRSIVYWQGELAQPCCRARPPRRSRRLASTYDCAVPALRVLDLSRVLAGPVLHHAARRLGRGRSSRSERPGAGDDTRAWGPPYAGGEAAYFLALNRGKRSVAVDLARPEGQEVVQRLSRSADVVVENFRAGTAERLGVGYERLAQERPGLVYCSITGFGDARPGYDFVVQAESGLMAITGEADGEPVKVGVAVVDVLAGYAAATAILAAKLSGERKHIEISLLDVALSSLGERRAVGPRDRRRARAPRQLAPEHRSVPDLRRLRRTRRDRGRQRRALQTALRGLGRPDLAEDERFVTNPARVANRDELAVELGAVFARRSADEWVERLTEAGFPAGKVRGVLEAITAHGPATIEHLTVGALPQVPSPFGLADKPPPLLGEHTREVLEEAGVRGPGGRRARGDGRDRYVVVGDREAIAFSSATRSRRARVSSCTKIWIIAASGTAVSAPSTPSSAPKSVTETMMKNGREVDRLALDLRREDVVLELLVDEHDDEHDHGRPDALLRPERRDEDEAGDRRADVRDHVEQARDHSQGDGVARAEQPGRRALDRPGD